MATVYAVYVFVHVQLRDLQFLIKKPCSFLDSTEKRGSLVMYYHTILE